MRSAKVWLRLFRLSSADRGAALIIAYVQGGLGNQLFQYAMARAVADRWDCQFTLDTAAYRGDPFRKYQLDRFRITSAPFMPWHRVGTYLLYRPKLRRFQPICYAVAPSLRLNSVEDKMEGFDPAVFERRERPFFTGFWQSEKYFEQIRLTLLDELQFREPADAVNSEWLSRIKDCNAVCLHVRRTDYLHQPAIAVLTGDRGRDYYRAAVGHIALRVTDPTYFIFSDDPDWTKANLDLGPRTHFIAHNLGQKDHEDLRLMMHCKHFIIANSTFSWWGAWLAQNPEKIVIAPRIWRYDLPRFCEDVTPRVWIHL